MKRDDLELLEGYSLRCLVRAPRTNLGAARPVLCFLHGYEEGAPAAIFNALTCHGPLHRNNPVEWIDRFLIVAPQLPTKGDVWTQFAAAVREIVLAEARRHGCNVGHICVTGFSFGGNGAFDLALEQSDLWSAAWAVDPTRVPQRPLDIPVWVSIGGAARYQQQAFVRKLSLVTPEQGGDRIWADEGVDHVGTARAAYKDSRVYEWLLGRAPRATNTIE